MKVRRKDNVVVNVRGMNTGGRKNGTGRRRSEEGGPEQEVHESNASKLHDVRRKLIA